MSDIWDEDFEEKMNDHYRKTAMTDKPQRDKHITRMLNQLSGGVGTFLQADGEKLVEFVRGLEQKLATLSQPGVAGAVINRIKSFDCLPALNQSLMWSEPPVFDDRWVRACAATAERVRDGIAEDVAKFLVAQFDKRSS